MCLAELHRSGRGQWWLTAGAAFGLGLCSKYTTAFFAVSILAWLIAVREHRRWLISLWAWGGGLLALALFSPVLVWNAQHQWASLVYQSGRLTVYVWTLRYLMEFVCALLILATPPIFVLGVVGLATPTHGRREFSARGADRLDDCARRDLLPVARHPRARSGQLAGAGLPGLRHRGRLCGAPLAVRPRRAGGDGARVAPAGGAVRPGAGADRLCGGDHRLPAARPPRPAHAGAGRRLEGARSADRGPALAGRRRCDPDHGTTR